MKNPSRYVEDHLRLLLEQGISPLDIFRGISNTFCVGWEDGLDIEVDIQEHEQIDKCLGNVLEIFQRKDKTPIDSL